MLPVLPSKADFQRVLDDIFREMDQKHKSEIIVTAREVYRRAGVLSGSDPSVALCCSVMRENMRPGDTVITEPPGGQGATLAIRYKLPR
jgi:5-methylcytosine-specific restriction protein A